MRGTYRNGEHVHIIASRAADRPEVVESGASGHGDGVVELGNDEGKADRVLG